MPRPYKGLVPRPYKTLVPRPYKTLVPRPYKTLVPRPYKTLVPRPYKTLVPRPYKGLVPRPYKTLVPRPSVICAHVARHTTSVAGLGGSKRSDRWYGDRAVRGSRLLKAVALGLCGVPAGLLAVGCGGGSPQDASEPKGNYTVQVTHASFPLQQVPARQTQMVIDVRNTSSRTLPDVTVAVTSFDYLSNYPHLASRRRPIWVVNEGPGQIAKPPVETVQVDPPGGGTTANYDIWALGPLAPGATRSFVWHVSPVKSGVHRLSYRVYAGLNGRAKAELANGAPPVGSFNVDIADKPPTTHVNPVTGRVVAGPYVPSEG